MPSDANSRACADQQRKSGCHLALRDRNHFPGEEAACIITLPIEQQRQRTLGRRDAVMKNAWQKCLTERAGSRRRGDSGDIMQSKLPSWQTNAKIGSCVYSAYDARTSGRFWLPSPGSYPWAFLTSSSEQPFHKWSVLAAPVDRII